MNDWNDLSEYERQRMWVCPPAEFTYDATDGLHWPTINYTIWDHTDRGPAIRAPRPIEMVMLWAIGKQYMRVKSAFRLYIGITLYRSLPRGYQKERGDYRVRVVVGYFTDRALYHDLNRLHTDIDLTWNQIKELYRA